MRKIYRIKNTQDKKIQDKEERENFHVMHQQQGIKIFFIFLKLKSHLSRVSAGKRMQEIKSLI